MFFIVFHCFSSPFIAFHLFCSFLLIGFHLYSSCFHCFAWFLIVFHRCLSLFIVCYHVFFFVFHRSGFSGSPGGSGGLGGPWCPRNTHWTPLDPSQTGRVFPVSGFLFVYIFLYFMIYFFGGEKSGD